MIALGATTGPGTSRPWKFTPITLAKVALWATLAFDVYWVTWLYSGLTRFEAGPALSVTWADMYTWLLLFAPPPVAAIPLLVRIHRRRDLRGALIVALVLAVHGVLTAWIFGSFFVLPAAALVLAVGWRRFRSRPTSRTTDEDCSASGG